MRRRWKMRKKRMKDEEEEVVSDEFSDRVQTESKF